MLTAKDTVQFWGADDIVTYGSKIIFTRKPDFNPVGEWPGSAPSLDELFRELALARISYVLVTSDNGGVRKTVVVLSGRIVVTGTIFMDEDPWRLKLNRKGGIKFASNTLRARILSRSVRMRHEGVLCVTWEVFGRDFERSNTVNYGLTNNRSNAEYWSSGEYCKKLVQHFEDGIPKKSEVGTEEPIEEIPPLAEDESQVLDALQQFVEAEHELEDQAARETPPFAYVNCQAEARQVVYRQFFTLTLDHEDLERLRDLKPSLLRIENAAEEDIMASVVNLSPAADKPQILISVEKQVNAESIPRSGLLWLTALPTLKNVRNGVVELLRDRQSPNSWLVPVSAQTHRFGMLRPAQVRIPQSKFPPNPSQLQAIKAGAGTDDLLLVLGPPGTGKTTVILCWAEHFVSQGKRVLVTSQNNKAVDNVLERLAEKETLECVRLGDETKVSSTVHEILIDNYAVKIQKKLVSDLDATLESLASFQQYLDTLHPQLQQYDALMSRENSLRDRVTAIRSREIPELENRLRHMAEEHRQQGEALTKLRKEAAETEAGTIKREKANIIMRFFYKPLISQGKARLEALSLQERELEGDLARIFTLQEELKLRIPPLAAQAETLEMERATVETERRQLFTASGPADPLHGSTPFRLDFGPPFDLQRCAASVRDRRAKYGKLAGLVREWQSLMTSERQQALYSLLLSFVDVVGATCIGINTNKAFKDTLFDVVIVDESGQIQLHNVMVPLSRGPKAILVGDHKQLPPVVDPALLEEVEERGSHYDTELLRKSWFELLWDQLPENRKVMLNTQFRCPAVISDFISKAFYGEQYFAGTGMEEKQPIFPFFKSTLVFIDTSGLRDRLESKNEATVTGNRKETEIVLSVLQRALDEQPALGSGEIGVIVPYKNHAMEVRDAIRKQRKRGSFVSIAVPLDELVATVDSFQGQERDLIIFPFTRSNLSGGIGFLKDWRRLNVAMTRTKKQLVMIGDLSTLTKHPRNREMDEMERTFKESMSLLREYTQQHGELIDARQWLNSARSAERR